DKAGARSAPARSMPSRPRRALHPAVVTAPAPAVNQAVTFAASAGRECRIIRVVGWECVRVHPAGRSRRRLPPAGRDRIGPLKNPFCLPSLRRGLSEPRLLLGRRAAGLALTLC